MKTNVPVEYRQNQTLEHNKLVERCYMWLAERAYRGIRATSEFTPSNGYSADLVAIMSFFGKRYNERYVPEEFRQQKLVLVCEAKVTRSDYLKHFGEGRDNIRTQAPMGNLHWILATAGLIDPSELPKTWGLLEERGASLVEVKKPAFCPMTKERLHEIEGDMLWAEAHHMRELECYRVLKIVEAMEQKGVFVNKETE